MKKPGSIVFSLVILIVTPVLAACSGTAGIDQVPTLIPTAATAAMPDGVTPSPRATGAEPTPAPTLRATSTPHPSPTPCAFLVQRDLADAWRPDELGCPITHGTSAVPTAYAPFEGGQMLWRGDTDIIYVLYGDGRWASYANEWREGDPEIACGEANPLITPVRGFGRVWCDHPDVRTALGAVTADEIGDSASAVQDFVNGTIVVAPFGGVFILEGEDGTWRRLEE